MSFSPDRNSVFSSGSYYFDEVEGKLETVNRERDVSPLTEGPGFDHELPGPAAVEHIDWVRLYSADPAVLIVSGIHGDEFETAELFEQTQAEFLIPRTQLLRAHLAAVFMGSRGYDAPKQSEDENDIDLNRQFPFQGDEKSWNDFLSRISYPEAQLLLEALRNNSQSEFLFSFHEDPLRRNNFYLYDGVYDASQDDLFEVVRNIRIDLHAELLSHGFKMLNGLDDTDPNLANIAKNGYIYQPLINRHGMRKTDNTFESAAIELGGKNLINISRAFTFEIPGRLSTERKAQLIKIIQSHFIVPFLATQGITI